MSTKTKSKRHGLALLTGATVSLLGCAGQPLTVRRVTNVAVAEGVIYTLPKVRIVAEAKYQKVCDCIPGSAGPTAQCRDEFTEPRVTTIATPDPQHTYELRGEDGLLITNGLSASLSATGELTKATASSKSEAVKVVAGVLDAVASAVALAAPEVCQETYQATLRAKLIKIETDLQSETKPDAIKALVELREKLAAQHRAESATYARGVVRCELEPTTAVLKQGCSFTMDKGVAPPDAVELLLTPSAQLAGSSRALKGIEHGFVYRIPRWTNVSLRTTRNGQAVILTTSDVAVPQLGHTALLSLAEGAFAASNALEIELHEGTGALKSVKADSAAFSAEDINQLTKSAVAAASAAHTSELENLIKQNELLRAKKEHNELLDAIEKQKEGDKP